MLLEMRKLIVEAKANSEELSTDNSILLRDLEICSKSDHYAPTEGQLVLLRALCEKKSPEMNKNDEKVSQSRKRYHKRGQ